MADRRCACGLLPIPARCTCGHLEQNHNLSSNGSRTACSVSNGPTAVPCGCKRYEVAS